MEATTRTRSAHPSPISDYCVQLGHYYAVENFLRSTTNTILHRFYGDKESSYARTINFSIRRSDIEELKTLYEEVIYPKVNDLEERSRGHKDSIDLSLSVSWAPSFDEPH